MTVNERWRVGEIGTYDTLLYVMQSVAYTDAVAAGYTITITFMVIER